MTTRMRLALIALGLAWDIRMAKIAQAVPYEENDTLVVSEEAVA